MTHSSRISIVLPVTFAVIWIALICLAIPDFAVASTRVAGNGHFQTTVDGD
ncbi:MAG TPA: hypothetical protein VKB27_07495 [Gammaproteobacteria bacterium]|nr:hypothetical protein [Gammaproteobacteria bacterium]